MEIKIREMKERDIEQVQSLGIKTKELYSSKEAMWYPKIALKKWLSSREGDILLVAESKGKIVGFCLSYVHFGTWAVMDSIAIGRNARRGGVATSLISEMTSRLKKRGVRYMQAFVHSDNDKMLKLTKKLGFSRGYNFYIVDKFLDRPTGGKPKGGTRKRGKRPT